MKRTLDLLLTLPALLLLCPVLLACALAVRLSSPGPVFFRQQRLGLHGQLFWLWKFRSMRANAEVLRNPDGSAANPDHDPRITSVGHFLRRSSLDELPQLFNVLTGDMSLVGPRPDLADQIIYYSEFEKQKLLVRPGLTGLAQISGRNSISWEQRKALDVEYVRTRTLWLDIRLLFLTIPYVLLGQGIHTERRTA
jgi:undecaprenyl phosphate N,N'-diacetylbacillosamine 1-phosphate transferase